MSFKFPPKYSPVSMCSTANCTLPPSPVDFLVFFKTKKCLELPEIDAGVDGGLSGSKDPHRHQRIFLVYISFFYEIVGEYKNISGISIFKSIEPFLHH